MVGPRRGWTKLQWNNGQPTEHTWSGNYNNQVHHNQDGSIHPSAKVTAHHEKLLREKAANNSCMKFFNVQLLGLSGRPHPSLLGIVETRQAQKVRAHLQLLTGDFPSFELIGQRQKSDQSCRLCSHPVESTQHILIECCATSDVKERLLPELLNLIAAIDSTNELLFQNPSRLSLTQFILDPTSFNLNSGTRISFQNTRLPELFTLCRDWCFSVIALRKKLLQSSTQ